jgi:hypothetical protein
MADDGLNNDDEPYNIEDFEVYAVGENPSDWLDTAAKNSMTEDDSLFKVYELGGEKAFGTTSTATNIHSHYFGADIEIDSGYEYTGRMMMTASTSGIGVTFFSQYPGEDAYYRLRRYGSSSFHIAPHPHGKNINGDTDTGALYPTTGIVSGSRWKIPAVARISEPEFGPTGPPNLPHGR